MILKLLNFSAVFFANWSNSALIDFLSSINFSSSSSLNPLGLGSKAFLYFSKLTFIPKSNFWLFNSQFGVNSYSLNSFSKNSFPPFSNTTGKSKAENPIVIASSVAEGNIK